MRITEEERKKLGLSRRFPRYIEIGENPNYKAGPPVVHNPFDLPLTNDDDIFSLDFESGGNADDYYYPYFNEGELIEVKIRFRRKFQARFISWDDKPDKTQGKTLVIERIIGKKHEKMYISDKMVLRVDGVRFRQPPKKFFDRKMSESKFK